MNFWGDVNTLPVASPPLYAPEDHNRNSICPRLVVIARSFSSWCNPLEWSGNAVPNYPSPPLLHFHLLLVQRAKQYLLALSPANFALPRGNKLTRRSNFLVDYVTSGISDSNLEVMYDTLLWNFFIYFTCSMIITSKYHGISLFHWNNVFGTLFVAV